MRVSSREQYLPPCRDLNFPLGLAIEIRAGNSTDKGLAPRAGIEKHFDGPTVNPETVIFDSVC